MISSIKGVLPKIKSRLRVTSSTDVLRSENTGDRFLLVVYSIISCEIYFDCSHIPLMENNGGLPATTVCSKENVLLLTKALFINGNNGPFVSGRMSTARARQA